MSFFEELKRRNVFRVGIAYGVAGWVILQIADLVLEAIEAPAWVLKALLLLAVLGFAIALVIAWAYEMTPDGIKKEADVDRSQSIAPDTGRKMDRIIIAFLVVAVAVLLYRQSGTDDNEPAPASAEVSQAVAVEAPPEVSTAPTDTRQSVAVIPFVNMSDDASNEYFSDGISEELLNVLVKIESLRVPSRTSSFTFKNSGKKVSEIGRELNVDHVLEGSVRKAGDRIRVTAQLIDVETDTHLWSDTYTRELDDIFAVQDEISKAIVEALQVTLSGSDQEKLANHLTDNVEAYNKFLLGRHLWNLRTTKSLLDAVTPLREAVALDPEFDRAWAALADAYILIPEYRGGSMAEYGPLTKDAVEKALAINPDSARALTTRGYYRATHLFDYENAIADFKRAISIDPSYPTGHQWYGEVLNFLRRPKEAIEQIRIALELDPLAPIIHQVMGFVQLDSNGNEDGFTYFATALRLNPNMPGPVNNLIRYHLESGNFEQARVWAKRKSETMGEDISLLLEVIDAIEKPALRKEVIKKLQNSGTLNAGVNFVVKAYVLLGEDELAIDELETGLLEGNPYSVIANVGPVFEPLRSNPRFQEYLGKMNLWPESGGGN
ncbi:MAG: TolB-like protein/Flp pilus assembly protein TadD [Rhodothermales bacterium]|jgi:TolB-like protein/Flp pilus assembly protein TadD